MIYALIQFPTFNFGMSLDQAALGINVAAARASFVDPAIMSASRFNAQTPAMEQQQQRYASMDQPPPGFGPPPGLTLHGNGSMNQHAMDHRGQGISGVAAQIGGKYTFRLIRGRDISEVPCRFSVRNVHPTRS
jgi:hypothetical protein